MVMTPQPISNAINSIDKDHNCLRIYMSPRGKTLNQNLVKKLANDKDLLIVCGSYEGIDQRIIDKYIDMEISIGDYITTSGDLACINIGQYCSKIYT